MTSYLAMIYAVGVAGIQVAQERLEIRGEQPSGYLASEQQSASKLDIAIKETPQTVTVITQERISDFALTDMTAALENSATINVEQVETERTHYTSRGFEINNFQIDGLGLPLVNNNSRGRIDTALYERIEVVHGANGIMTGVGSPSATVNRVRKRPKSQAQGSVSTSISSWSGKRIEGDFTGALTDTIRGRMVVVGDDRESYLARYENNSQLFYGVVDYAPTANTLITLGHSKQRSDTDGNMWGALTLHYGDGTPTHFDRSTNTAANWSQWDVQENLSFVDIETALSDRWSLRFAFNHTGTNEDAYLFFTYVPNPTTGLDPDTGLGLMGYSSDFNFESTQASYDLSTSGQLTLAGLDHEWVFGANYTYLDFTEESLYDFHTGNGFPAMPALEDWDGHTPFPEFTDGRAGSDIENTQKAIYAQTRFSLSGNTKLLLGGRYNEFTTKGLQYGVDQTRDEGRLIPYVGVTHKLTHNTTLYASYTETFQAQNLRDRNFVRLPALTGENAEMGFKSELANGGALLSAAYFQVKQKNLAVGDGTITNPNTNAPTPIYRAVEGVTSRGVEVELAGALTSGLQGSIAATSFEVDGDEMVEGYTPENLVRIALTYRFASIEALKVGGSFHWQDTISRQQGVVSQVYQNAGETIITKQGAYGRLNLMASYQFNDAVSLTLNANNLFDKKYINSLLWPTQGYYGAPGHYSATLRWNF